MSCQKPLGPPHHLQSMPPLRTLASGTSEPTGMTSSSFAMAEANLG